ncbi:MAG: protein kinase [Planctomycetota bacterium]
MSGTDPASREEGPQPDPEGTRGPQRLEALLDDFDASSMEAWQRGAPPDIGMWIDKGRKLGLDQQVLLTELIGIDLEYRVRNAAKPTAVLEQYLERFADLRFTADLWEDEVRWRKRRAELIVLQSEQSRFSPERFRSEIEYQEGLARVTELITPGVETTPDADGLFETQLTDQSDPTGSAAQSQPFFPRGADTWSALRARFEQREMLGRGSFGTVWKGHDRELHREVAIKSLPIDPHRESARRETLLSEAQTAAALDHRHIVTIHDVISDEQHVHIVMGLVEGVPLDKWFHQLPDAVDQTTQRGSVSDTAPSSQATVEPKPIRLARMMAEVADGVHHAHQSGLIHCDLKPQNIMVDARDQASILDFGLAVHRHNQEDLSGKIAGTPAYMSPEQTWGAMNHLDGRSDIWSLGVILYRMLTGFMPFDGSTTDRVFDAIQTRAVTPPAQLRDDVPTELAEICMRCLQKSIESRYDTAADLAQALREYVQLQSHARSGSARKARGIPSGSDLLVGREAVIEEAVSSLSRGTARLLSLVGPGGIGKTATAISVARQVAARGMHEVVWVDLSAASDIAQLASVVQAALRLEGGPDQSASQNVAQAISIRGPVLLILDNLEQLLPDASVPLREWLNNAEELSLLVTTQVPILVAGEECVRLGGLVDEEQGQATRLFWHRVGKAGVSKRGTLDDRHAAEICRLLDGNPLAIELAAARAGTLGVARLRDRLRESFAVLKSQRHDRPDRHRTLTNVVQWSVELLNATQKQALDRLAIWPAPLPLELAEQLLGDLGEDALDLIENLVERSLLRVLHDDAHASVISYRSVTLHTLSTLDEEQRRVTAERLLTWYAGESGRLPQDASELVSESEVPWLATVACRGWMAENIATAVQWSHSGDSQADATVEAIIMADRFTEDQVDARVRVPRLKQCVSFRDAAQRLRWQVQLADALRLIGQQEETELILHEAFNSDLEIACFAAWSRAGEMLSQMHFRRGEAENAFEIQQRVVQRLHDQGARMLWAKASLELAELLRRDGRVPEADVELAKVEDWLGQDDYLGSRIENDAMQSDRPDDATLGELAARAMIQRGKIKFQSNQHGDARALFDEVANRLSGTAPRRLMQQTLLGRAAAAAEMGDFENATKDYDRCERLSRRLGDLPTLAQALTNRAITLGDAGDATAAERFAKLAIDIHQRVSDPMGIALASLARASAKIQQGKFDDARTILLDIENMGAIPAQSLHHAILMGELGTVDARLNNRFEAENGLQLCLDHLERLGLERSPDALLYRLEQNRLQGAAAPESEPDAGLRQMVQRWCHGQQRRARLDEAIREYRMRHQYP